jgi:hypothetical protein
VGYDRRVGVIRELKSVARNTVYRLRERRLGPPTPAEEQRAAVLRDAIVRDQTVIEGPWGDNIRRLQQLALTEDPRGFLNWDVVLRSMFIDVGRTLRTEIDYLRKLPSFATRWAPALKETSVGLPLPFMWYPRSSANLVHHAYHVARFEAATGTTLTDYDTIVEFGAGYGSFARLSRNLGFAGSFVSFDLPAFSALQQYFLGSAGYLEAADHRWATTTEQLDETLRSVPGKRRLFAAMWSVSEAPFEIRRPVLASVGGFDAFLIGFQARWQDMDNRDFFAEWKQAHARINWHDEPIAHIPGNHYLFGTAP